MRERQTTDAHPGVYMKTIKHWSEDQYGDLQDAHSVGWALVTVMALNIAAWAVIYGGYELVTWLAGR